MARDEFLGTDAETIRSIVVQNMVAAAAELLARAPFVSVEERIGAVAQVGDAVLPEHVEIQFEREVQR